MPDPVSAAVVGGSQVVGGYMQNKAAKQQAGAMNAQAAAQAEAARIAAEEARFRPVGITTRFGSATPEFTNDRLTGYDYQGSPELVGLQDQLSRIYGSSLGQAEQAGAYQPQFQQAAQNLFALGQQEMPQSREQIMAEQQALLRPYDLEAERRSNVHEQSRTSCWFVWSRRRSTRNRLSNTGCCFSSIYKSVPNCSEP